MCTHIHMYICIYIYEERSVYIITLSWCSPIWFSVLHYVRHSNSPYTTKSCERYQFLIASAVLQQKYTHIYLCVYMPLNLTYIYNTYHNRIPTESSQLEPRTKQTQMHNNDNNNKTTPTQTRTPTTKVGVRVRKRFTTNRFLSFDWFDDVLWDSTKQ